MTVPSLFKLKTLESLLTSVSLILAPTPSTNPSTHMQILTASPRVSLAQAPVSPALVCSSLLNGLPAHTLVPCVVNLPGRRLSHEDRGQGSALQQGPVQSGAVVHTAFPPALLGFALPLTPLQPQWLQTHQACSQPEGLVFATPLCLDTFPGFHMLTASPGHSLIPIVVQNFLFSEVFLSLLAPPSSNFCPVFTFFFCMIPITKNTIISIYFIFINF